MKRILIFIFALGVISTASATTVDLTCGGSSDVQVAAAGDTITVDLTLDFASTGIYQIDFVTDGMVSIDAVGAWLAPMDTYGSVAGADFDGTLESNGIFDAYGETLDGATEVAAGTAIYRFEATVTGEGTIAPQMGPNDYSFTLSGGYSGDELTMNGMNVSVIPEPVTVVLLGLGALALSKRR